MNKTDLQNLLFNVRHGSISVDRATYYIETLLIFPTEAGPEPQKEPWQLYPDYRSCIKEGLTFYCYDYFYGGIKHFVIERENLDKIYCTSLKLAKRQLAELQLAKIADKWGEEIKLEYGDYIWFPIYIDGEIVSYPWFHSNEAYFNNPFHFKTEEQCKKSIELHQQLWKDWFMID
jgi:hypothetical protein